MIEIKETMKRLKDVFEYFIRIYKEVITEYLQQTSDSWRKRSSIVVACLLI